MIETVNKDDLSELAKYIEVMRYTIQEVVEDYFDKLDSKDEHDSFGILWDFNRNRARVEIISNYLLQSQELLEKQGISYWHRAG